MKIKTLFILSAVVMGLLGLAMLILPDQFTALFGNTLDSTGKIYAQLFGGATIAFAVVTWFARDTGESEARRSIVMGGFTYSVLGLIVILINQFAGNTNALGWVTALLLLLFTVGFGIFVIKKPE